MQILDPVLSNFNQPVTVVLSYCQPAYSGSGNSAVILLNVNANGQSAVTNCKVPILGNYFWVDYHGTTQQDQALGDFNGGVTSTTYGVGYWMGDGNATSITSCKSVTFVETLPQGLSDYCGTFNVVAAISDNYQNCGTGTLNASGTVSVPCTSSAVTAIKTVQGSQAAVGDLLLFEMDYQYKNDSSNFVVTDTVPAGTTLVSAGPGTFGTIPGYGYTGTAAGSAISWVFPPNNSPATVTSGQAWMLVRVTNTGTITNSAHYSPIGSTSATLATNSVSASSNSSGFTLLKSESQSTLQTGQTETYTLFYHIEGASLKLFDSYDNNTVGSSITDPTCNAASVSAPFTGFDGTGYTLLANGGTNCNPSPPGTWTVRTDANGNHYLEAFTTTQSGGNSGGPYSMLLRNSPVSLCSGSPYVLQGDMQIPVTASGNSGGAPQSDAHMVVAYSVCGGVTVAYTVGISLDPSPDNLFIQKDGGGTPVAGIVFNGTPFSITAGVWYTMHITVQHVGTSMVFNISLWPKNNPSAVAALSWTDTAVDPCICSGPTSYGWQGDGTAGTDYYSNLSLFDADPVINTVLTDTVMNPGISYIGQSTAGAGVTGVVFSGAPTNLKWSFPATVYDLTGAITWWGAVTCTDSGYVTNVSVINASNASNPVTSNAVTAAVSGCTTSTPTNTPTNTNTNTPTNTFTITPTNTPTNTPTVTDTNTPTNTPTNTNTITPTNTPTNTPTVTNTNTPTNTPTVTPTRTPTNTPTNTNTVTPTNTPTNTVTPTNTNTPTNTFTLTPTNTPTDTPTYINTPTPTNTFTVTDTNTPTNTPTDTFTPTYTNTPTYTFTVTPTNTVTNTPTNTNTPTPTNTPIPSATPTDTPTPTNTATVTPTYTPTNTPTDTNTVTPTNTPTNTTVNTPTNTPTNTNTFTATNTRTNTATPTATNTPTLTATDTPTVTPTSTPTSNLTLSKQVSASSAKSGDTLNYTLNINVTGNPLSGAAVTDLLPAGVSYVGPLPNTPASLPNPVYVPTPSELVWTLGTLAPGAYQLAYQGQVNSFVAGGATLTNSATVFGNAGGTLLTAGASANVVVSGQYTVKIAVYNEAGEVVKQIAIAQYSEPIENINLQPGDVITSLHGADNKILIYYQGVLIGTWDGTDSSGTPVTNGSYYIKIDNVDPYGVVRSTTQQVMVSRAFYTTTIFIYNEAGEVVRHLYSYTDDPIQNTITGVQLSSHVIAPNSGTVSSGTPSQLQIGLNAGSTVITTAVWDGRSDAGAVVQNGQYLVEVHTFDGQGGETTIIQQVSVEDRFVNTGVGKIVAQPNILNSTNGMATTFADNLALNPSMDYRLQASIYTVAGELVGQLGPGVPAPGNQTVYLPWNAQGLASGLYLAVLELRDSNGGIVSRQTVKVVVLH